jgi:hypothetical protein
MASAPDGYAVGVDRAELRARNWPALAALWTLGSVWLAIGVLIFLAGVFDFEPPEAVGWAILLIALAGFTLALVGISSIRTRGETALALAALALALTLPAGSWFFAFSLFGGLGVD